MPLNVPTFLKRLGSSVVFVAIMLTGLLWNEWSFFALICLINFLCLREYMRLMQKVDTQSYWPRGMFIAVQTVGFLLLILFVLLKNSGTDDEGQYTHVTSEKIGRLIDAAISVLSPVLLLILTLSFMICGLSRKVSLSALFQSIGGLLYITLPMLFLLYLQTINHYLPLFIILMIWSNDTMAYLVGSFIGKHSLSPVSPKKTWEGTVGGALVTVVAVGIAAYFLQKNADPNLIHPVTSWVKLGLCVTIAGTFGDLFESKLKRLADVKDSGSMMPGHGGALDRFDSLLIATPFAFIFIMCFMK